MFTTDTRQPNCPISIMYASDAGEIEPVTLIYASSLESKPQRWASGPLAVIRLTEHSDYSGEAVHASNYRVLEERFPWLFRIYGSHGYQALAYDASLGPVPESEDLCEVLEDLEHYRLLDEDDHTELENELETEAWEDDGRCDFRRALISLLNNHYANAEYEHDIPDDEDPAPDAIGDLLKHRGEHPNAWKGVLDALWRAGCDAFNVNGGSGYEVETGSLVYFFIGDWCAKAKRHNDVTTTSTWPVIQVLRKLEELTRIVER